MDSRTTDVFLINNIKDGTELIATKKEGLQFKSIETKKEKLTYLYEDHKNIEHKDMPNVYKTEESSGVGNQQRVRPGEILTNSIYKHKY